MTSRRGPEQGPAAGLGNLQLRVISAVVLGVVVLAVTWLGGLAFRVFVCAMALAIVYEWLKIVAPEKWGRHEWMVVALLAGALVALLAGAGAVVLIALLAVAVAAMLVDAALGKRGYWPSVGLAYAGLAALAIALLRGDDQAGLWAILFLFAVAWATDILAYFVGRAAGGPKLAPGISPGKTWSGAIGGAAGGVLAGAAVALSAGSPAGLFTVLVLSLALSVVAQLGDLFESFLKRRHSVKDSGSLIPGHGGVLDRVDGLVAASIAFYVLCALVAGPDRPAAAFFGP